MSRNHSIGTNPKQFFHNIINMSYCTESGFQIAATSWRIFYFLPLDQKISISRSASRGMDAERFEFLMKSSRAPCMRTNDD